MTPTLSGRWQTRFLLLSTFGLVVTLLFGYVVTPADHTTPLALLGYVLLFGFGWDWFYIYLQSFRWDRDWPTIFQLAAGVWEGLFIWGCLLALAVWQPWGWSHLPGVAPDLPFTNFFVHYSAVWLITFLASQGLLRIVFLRWRFNGGEWI